MTDDAWIRGTVVFMCLCVIVLLAITWALSHNSIGGPDPSKYYYTWGPIYLVFEDTGDTVFVQEGDRLGFYTDDITSVKILGRTP